MKIQEVIDEVNSTWGEEHEEKRKKIFRENIFWKPLYMFRDVSLFYLFVTLVFLIFYMFGPRFEGVPNIFSPAYVFNFPYYFFDVRAGIIASLASILLSLYVSVGKFADGAEGITGDARRAVYRNFARIVGDFVSVVLILNFWHGFLAGYFQGSSYAPMIFDPLSHGPEWGKYIVPEGIDLSRYAEIPLWILFFFAWFTLASSYMLTYNEKDVLVRNALILKRVRNLNILNGQKVNDLYQMILKYIDEDSSVRSLGVKGGSIATKYSEGFVYRSNYQGFEFLFPGKEYRKRKEFLWAVCRWGIILAVCASGAFSLKIFQFSNPKELIFLWVACSLSILFILLINELVSLSDDQYLYRCIYDFNMKNTTDSRVLRREYWRFIGWQAVSGYLLKAITFALGVSFGGGYSMVYLLTIHETADLIAVGFISLVFVYILSFGFYFLNLNKKGKVMFFYESLENHSKKYLPKYIKELQGVALGEESKIAEGVSEEGQGASNNSQKNEDSINDLYEIKEFYLIVAYIYCAVLKVDECYIKYKSDIDLGLDSMESAETKAENKS